MSDAPNDPTPVPGESLEQLRVNRWTKEATDVPEAFTDHELLRSIAMYSRAQAESSKTTANWLNFIGLVVLVQVVIVLAVVFGAITLETTTGF